MTADLRAALTFAEFASTNRSRCESPDGFGHPVDGWSLSDWMLAATGEFGEAANVAKKLNRVRDGIPGNTQTPEELHAALADEFADAVIYLDLAAQSQGIDLGAAIVSKFNRTSEKIGAPHRLRAVLASTPEPAPVAQPLSFDNSSGKEPAPVAEGLDAAIAAAAESEHQRWWVHNQQSGHTETDWRRCQEWPCRVLAAASPSPETEVPT